MKTRRRARGWHAALAGGLSVTACAAGDAPTKAPVATRATSHTATSNESAPSSVQIVAGTAHACALLPDHSVRCWGRNDIGQLGDGTRTTRLVPVRVALPNVGRLVASGDSTCAILADGTASCWGESEWLEPLDLSRARGFRTRPEPLGFTGGVRELAWARDSICALDRAGAIKCKAPDATFDLSLGNPATQLGMGGALVCAAIKDGRAVECVQLDEQHAQTKIADLAIAGRAAVAVFGVRVCALDDGAVRCVQPITTETKHIQPPFSPDLPAGEVQMLLPSGHVVMKGGAVAQLLYDRAAAGFTLARSAAWDGLSRDSEHLAFGDEFACASRGAVVRCFGDNTYGQLGQGNRERVTDAVTVQHLLDGGGTPSSSIAARAAQLARWSPPAGAISGFVQVWQNARVYDAPRADASRGRLADWEDALRLDPYEGRYAFHVKRTEGDFLHVEPIASLKGCAAPPLRELALDAWVARADLAPLLKRKKTLKSDGEAFVDLSAGSPLYPNPAGGVDVEAFGDRLAVGNDEDVGWSVPELTGGALAEGAAEFHGTLRVGERVIHTRGLAKILPTTDSGLARLSTPCAKGAFDVTEFPTLGSGVILGQPGGRAKVRAGATAYFESGVRAGRLLVDHTTNESPAKQANRICFARVVGSITLCFDPADVR